MAHRLISSSPLCRRRDFLQSGLVAASAALAARALRGYAADESDPARLAFSLEEQQFSFETGRFRGTLRQQGRSLGLTSLIDVGTVKQIARGYGIFSHYRLLDADTRYGHGAWDWPSVAQRLQDGEVEVSWSADDAHPFDMKAVYRWSAPQTLDLTTTVCARRDLKRLEVFLASYFDGFSASFVYAKGRSGDLRQAGFLEARRDRGAWQMYPRDESAVRVIQDGRWQRPPNPVDWQILPELAAPLAMRRDGESGLAALIMAPPDDCFAVATPYGEEGHRSLYLSLLGRDLKSGATATARSRLMIAHAPSDKQAIEAYEAYLGQL